MATPRRGLLAIDWPGEPFATAESARAHRLADLAEIVRRRGRTAG